MLPRLARAAEAVSGATDYNVLQNNGAAAHQAVFHVHFHIIPRRGEQGLGIGWKAGKLEAADAERLVRGLRAELSA